jgi:hypothetical protein
MSATLILLVHGDPWQGADVTAAVRDAANHLTGVDSTEGATVSLHRRASDDPLDAVRDEPAPWGAAIELALPGDDGAVLVRAADSLRPVLQATPEPDRTVVVAGHAHDLLRGTAPLRLVYCLRRRPDLSLEKFHRYWLEQHAAIALGEQGKRKSSYRQLHTDEERTAAITRSLGIPLHSYDGVAVSDMHAYDDLPLSSERGDRENFVDPDSETGIFAWEELRLQL